MTKFLFPEEWAPPSLPERMVWTASAIKTWRTCQRKFFWKYIARLRPLHSGPSLYVGKVFHNAIEAWYKDEEWNAPFDQAYQDLHSVEMYQNQEDVDRAETQLIGLEAALALYHEHYDRDADNWEGAQCEQSFVVNLGDFDYSGMIDVVHPKRGWLMEHKTASRIDEHYLDRLPIDIQMRGYMVGAQFGLDMKPKLMHYNVIRKTKLRRGKNETTKSFYSRVENDVAERPDHYFHRSTFRVTRDMQRTFLADILEVNRQFESALEEMGRENASDPNWWLTNDGACNEYFRSCDYLRFDLEGFSPTNVLDYEQTEHMHTELREATVEE